MKNYIVALLILLLKCSLAQIPNNGFDTWTTTGVYQSPTNWDNLNQVTYGSSIYTCVKGAPGYIGAAYLILTSKAISGKGVVPAIVVSGKIDTVTYKPIHGYPFVNRPQTLTYNLQYMPSDPSDPSSVTVLLSKWNIGTNKRDTVAFGGSYYNAMSHSWFASTTYLNYVSGENPDSAMIVISSSGSVPKNGSYIYIDNLQFNGNVVGIAENITSGKDITIFPNPASNFVTINEKDVESITIYSIQGQTEFEIETINSELKQQIDIKTLTNGIHFVKIKSKGMLLYSKFIKE